MTPQPNNPLARLLQSLQRRGSQPGSRPTVPPSQGRQPAGKALPGTYQEMYEKDYGGVPWDMPGGLGGYIRQLLLKLRGR